MKRWLAFITPSWYRERSALRERPGALERLEEGMRLENVRRRRQAIRDRLTGKVPAVPEALLVDEALRRLDLVAMGAWADLSAAEVLQAAEQVIGGGVAGIARDLEAELRAERDR